MSYGIMSHEIIPLEYATFSHGMSSDGIASSGTTYNVTKPQGCHYDVLNFMKFAGVAEIMFVKCRLLFRWGHLGRT